METTEIRTRVRSSRFIKRDLRCMKRLLRTRVRGFRFMLRIFRCMKRFLRTLVRSFCFMLRDFRFMIRRFRFMKRFLRTQAKNARLNLNQTHHARFCRPHPPRQDPPQQQPPNPQNLGQKWQRPSLPTSAQPHPDEPPRPEPNPCGSIPPWPTRTKAPEAGGRITMRPFRIS